MKKFISITILFSLFVVFLPVNVNAITQNQIDAEVQIVCTDGDDNWFSGSGTIIDPKGIILTNRHVVEGAYNNTCFIGFVESINKEPNFGTEGNYNFAEVKYVTKTNDMDAAILYLENKTNRSYPYVDIWSSSQSSLQLGDKIEVIGFPGIGGSTITYTSGDFSGYGGKSNGTENYIKATVSANHGNSGGAAYDNLGNFIGIPTAVISDISPITYILTIESIKNWLSSVLGVSYQREVTQQEAVIQHKAIIQNDITPPNINDIELWGSIGLGCSLTQKGFFSYEWIDCDDATGYAPQINLEEPSAVLTLRFYNYRDQQAYGADSSFSYSDFKGLYAYVGTDIGVIPSELNNPDYLSSSGLSESVFAKFSTGVLPEPGTYYIIMQAEDYSNNISDRIIWQYNYYPKDENEQLKSSKYMIYEDISKNNLLYSVDNNEFQDLIISRDGFYVEWQYENKTEGVSNEIKLKKKLPSGEFYENTKSNRLTLLEGFTSGNNINFKYLREGIKHYLFLTTSKGQEKFTATPFSITYNKNYVKEVINNETDIDFAEKLSGKILLQVEEHGEAYYVNPKDSKGYYMADGSEAYRIMRFLGVGITNKDLERVKADKSFAKQQGGKIFLQVEANGEAFYIDVDGDAYYLKDGEAAYGIMRDLGLGITNNDLNKIPKGSL